MPFVNSFVALGTTDCDDVHALLSTNSRWHNRLSQGLYENYFICNGYSVPYETKDNYMFLFTANIAYALDACKVLEDLLRCTFKVQVINPQSVNKNEISETLSDVSVDPRAGITFRYLSVHNRMPTRVSISTNGVASFDMTNDSSRVEELITSVLSLIR